MIWQDKTTKMIYQGVCPLVELTPLERNLLYCFLRHPEMNLTKTELIENSWPPDTAREGVSDESLFTLIRSLRKKLAKGEFETYEYITNWRGYPEGGYRFNPSGKAFLKTPAQMEQPRPVLSQLNMLQKLITNQKQTLELLENLIEEVADRI